MTSKKDIIDGYLEFEFRGITKKYDETSGKCIWFLNEKIVAGHTIEQKVFYYADSVRERISKMLSLTEEDSEDVIISWFIKKFDISDSDICSSYGIPIIDRHFGLGMDYNYFY